MRWLALCCICGLAVVGCGGSSLYDKHDVTRAFSAQGYDLIPLFENGPLVPRGLAPRFTVVVADSLDDAERYFATLDSMSSSSTYDVRERNVIVTADKRPSSDHVRRIESALESLRPD